MEARFLSEERDITKEEKSMATTFYNFVGKVLEKFNDDLFEKYGKHIFAHSSHGRQTARSERTGEIADVYYSISKDRAGSAEIAFTEIKNICDTFMDALMQKFKLKMYRRRNLNRGYIEVSCTFKKKGNEYVVSFVYPGQPDPNDYNSFHVYLYPKDEFDNLKGGNQK